MRAILQRHMRRPRKFTALMANIKRLASSKKTISQDFSAIQEHTESDISQFSQMVLSSFSELEDSLKDLENAFDEYKKTSLHFIDDFLSPEGIITKKRRIDEKIKQTLQKCKKKTRD